MALAKRRLKILLVLAALAITTLAWFLLRIRHKEWENDGSYPGPLTRTILPYNPTNPPSRPWLDPNPQPTPAAAYHTYHSHTINQQTDYLLYLPPNYDTDKDRYPVIYWLHGYGAHPHHADAFIQTLDAAIREGRCPPTIAVIPNGLRDSWYVDAADGSQPIESILTKDLIPHIDATYRTIPDRTARALEGFSMGGWGAAHLLFKHPDLFAAATLVGAPIHTPASFRRWHMPEYRKLFNADERQFYAEDPVTWARRHADTLRNKVRVRFVFGEWDGNRGWSHAFHKRLTEWQIPSTVVEAPKVGHSDAEVYDQLGPAAFEFYRDLFRR
jgi:endo-1,4-beta-xylanase